MTSEARIDRAKAIVNDRLLALGKDDTYEPVYSGLPVTHGEGVYLLKILERDLADCVNRGIPLNQAMAGHLHWAFLVGVFVGKDAEND